MDSLKLVLVGGVDVAGVDVAAVVLLFMVVGVGTRGAICAP